jgi:DNA replication initiation complex subunit (GINS family)
LTPLAPPAKPKGLSIEDLRPLAGHAIIALAICVGGYMLLVQPQRKVFAETMTQIASLESEIAGANALTGQISALSKRLTQLTSDATALSDAGSIARDESALYDKITSLATSNRITIQQLNPLKSESARATAPTSAPQPAPPVSLGPGDQPTKTAVANTSPKDIVVAYSIVFVAEYADVTRFLADLSSQGGLTSVKSVRVGPAGELNSTQVQGDVVVEFFWFDVAIPEPAGAPSGSPTASPPPGSMPPAGGYP